MNDPQRLLTGDGTSLERELLGSVLDEPVPPALAARMLAVLSLDPAALTQDGGSGLGGDAVTEGVGRLQSPDLRASLETTSSGASVGNAAGFGSVGLKALFATVGVGSLVTAALVFKQPESTPATAVSTTVDVPTASVQRATEFKPDLEPTPVGTVEAAVPIETSRVSPPVSGQVKAADARFVSEPRATSVGAQRTDSRTPNPSLSAELKLLDAARAAIQQSDKQRSLQALDAYAHKFPRGELTQEAKVLRGLAHQLPEP